MKKQSFIILFITLALLISAGVILFLEKNKQDNFYIQAESLFKNKDYLEVSFDQKLFYQAIENPDGFEIEGQVRGVILPHHELADRYIAKFFSQLAKEQKVSTFIILGPNHSNTAVWPAISTETYWQTELGPVYNQSDILSDLFDSQKVLVDEDNFALEYSTSVFVPFIKYYFPQATVVPIIFTSHHDVLMSQDLAKELSVYLKDKNTIVISSLDFSHYLDLEIAERNDQIILQAIKDKDYNLISNLNSDYLDSPPAMITLLEAMSLSGAGDFFLLDHSNSAYLTGINSNTTSYLTGYFYK